MRRLVNYRGRIIAATTFLAVISLWNFIYYSYNQYAYNPVLDTSFTLGILAVVWWLAAYYDKSKSLVDELKLSEEKHMNLLNSINYVVDNLTQVVFETDGQGRIVLLNTVWETFTGFEVNESVGQSWLAYIYPGDQERIKDNYSAKIENRMFFIREEVRLRKKEGGFVWVEINAKFSYCQHGKLASIVGTLTEISKRKAAESEMLQLNENLAIQSDKLSVIAQMSAAIAHEVRNPLTSISGFLQLLRERKELSDEYLEVIFSEMKRIELVLGEMLILSKPQAISFKKIDFSRTLDHVIALMSTEANMKSIELERGAIEAPFWIYGEENQLKQVFINIIKNAIEAMSDGGKIRIIPIRDRDYLSIYIKDEGPGIPQDIMKRVGRPFYTTKEKGTGLGLTICFKIIENHKGKIHITSEEGYGTTFEVILPIPHDGFADKRIS
ncbi:hypothetical protein WQ57_15395 [Mesobacillus campisalis]|uniref:histidine kinase n=1 Tax=Mesobacillus campisalis TaxID=1408103 RepID=A0A0M2SVX1_9BACI|nr:ATP-binding protein [Mesobacillus campisalis]KKK37112.1 hypothetical protein WQ57_15395 [Mesobacillus campisalis]